MDKKVDNNEKYDIHPDFAKWANFHPPLNRPTILFMQNLMVLTFLAEKSDNHIIVEKVKIPFGKKTVRAIMYTPKNLTTPAPCLLYIHGGGFVLPAAPYHYENARHYASHAHCKVLFLDYPLAPINKYPVPMNACFACFKWLVESAEALGIDPKKIAVGGDSAGGCFSTEICMLAADNNIQMPCAQVLIYPAVPCAEMTPSMEKFTDTPMCNSKDCKKYEKFYFANDEIKQDKYVTALNQEDMSIFPPTYIEVAEFDCLRDGALMFAERLKAANVPVVLHKPKQTIHGYDTVVESEISKNSVKKRENFLKNYFKNIKIK